MKNLIKRIWKSLPWESVYQKVTHYVWLFLTAIAFVLGAVFCETSEQIEAFVISVCVIAQVVAPCQELIRWRIKKDGFDAMNYLCAFVGFIEGGFLGAIVWFIIQNA